MPQMHAADKTYIYICIIYIHTPHAQSGHHSVIRNEVLSHLGLWMRLGWGGWGSSGCVESDQFLRSNEAAN